LCIYKSFYRHFNLQRENTEAKWTFKEDAAVVYSDVQGELIIGGVFLRLFIANPGWVLRRPKEFLTELLEKWSQLTSMTKPEVSWLHFLFFSH
jgi:DnaJ family protein C protein 13